MDEYCVLSRARYDSVNAGGMRNRPKLLRQVLLALSAFAIVCAANAGRTADFKNISEVRKQFKPSGLDPTEWHGKSELSRTSSMSITTTHWYSGRTGDYLYSTSWIDSITVASGTIIALPVEDFKEEETFTYFDADGRTVVTGKLVSVKIGIKASGKHPNSAAKMRAVKSLCESGAAVPDNNGKPGRIIALKKAVKRKFGASGVDVYYDEHSRSRVKFLVLKCDPGKAHDEVTAICYQ